MFSRWFLKWSHDSVTSGYSGRTPNSRSPIIYWSGLIRTVHQMFHHETKEGLNIFFLLILNWIYGLIINVRFIFCQLMDHWSLRYRFSVFTTSVCCKMWNVYLYNLSSIISNLIYTWMFYSRLWTDGRRSHKLDWFIFLIHNYINYSGALQPKTAADWSIQSLRWRSGDLGLVGWAAAMGTKQQGQVRHWMQVTWLGLKQVVRYLGGA